MLPNTFRQAFDNLCRKLRRPMRLIHCLVAVGVAAVAGCQGDEGDDGSGAAGYSGINDPGNSPPASVCISEIMYHPVLEQSFQDRHEFIELFNPTEQPINLSGWRFVDGVDYTFGADAIIQPGSFLVVAKDRAALLAVGAYSLGSVTVVGDYQGELSNGGERLLLIRADGTPADSLTYDDEFPWALAPDALGAGEGWLPEQLLPLEQHRYLGASLERVSCQIPANHPANWVPSDLDAPTPGGPNRGAGITPSPIVMAIEARPAESTSADLVELIREDDTVRVQIELSEFGEPGALELEYFIDDLSLTGEATQTVALLDDGISPDTAAGDRRYSALLPSAPDNSIIRYRVLGNAGQGAQAISPRISDPYAWHAYFVSPEITSQTAVYQLMIAPDDWTQLWDNIENGRADGCDVVASWNEKVPGVFVYNGQVHDVHARYHGSRWQRMNGASIRNWQYPGPDRPSPLLALSWRLSFPRYARFQQKPVVILNKLSQGCPGYTASVGFELFRRVGLPASETRFVRFHINGGYYHYMLELGHADEVMLERYHEQLAEQAGSTEVEPVGHLFKSQGYDEPEGEGPWGMGDGRLLEDSCGYAAAERYDYTYGRKTHDWLGSEEVMTLIEGLHEARAQGDDALRAYVAAQFDVELVLNYLAVMNWLAPWDDMFQNYFLYQRRSDLKWILVPWDLDLTFGGWMDNDSSVFVGEEGDPDNREDLWNYFKDAFLRSYREEFIARIKEFNSSILQPSVLNGLLDSTIAAAGGFTEAEQAPAGVDCDPEGVADQIRQFIEDRNALVNSL